MDRTPPPYMPDHTDRLRWARIRAGCPSLRSVHEKFGWNENTYKSHELGIRRAEGLSPKLAKRYGAAFNVSPDWLLTGRGDPFSFDMPEDERRVLDAYRDAKKKA